MKTKQKGPKTAKQEEPQTAEEKRLHSIALKKQEYKNHVSVVQAALANVDSQSNSKIIFDDDGEAPEHFQQLTNIAIKNTQLSTKKSLFDDDEEDDEIENEPNFEVKEQFQGKKGKKLMELQSKFKNDKRFTLDERFLDDEDEEEQSETEKMDVDDEDIAKEKEQEFAILEQVLGKKIVKSSDKKKPDKKPMLRYDPSQSTHSKFVVKESEINEEEEERHPEPKKQRIEETNTEEDKPEVSKETFYKVTDNLKDALQAGQSYSLLSMFGRTNEPEKDSAKVSEEKPIEIKKSTVKDINPFSYDSSGDSELSDHELETNVPENVQKETGQEETKEVESRPSLWTESLFFKKDDYRLQEGVNFLRKFEEAEEPQMFSKVRRDIMEIVRAKVRHNKRKQAPFQKKLGGKKKTKKGKRKAR